MGNRKPVLDWQMLEENAAWPPPMIVPRGGVPMVRRLPQRWRWWALGVLLAVALPVLVEGYREVRQVNQTMERVEHEVAAAAIADAWTRPPKPQRVDTLVAPLTGPAQREAFLTRSGWRTEPSPEMVQDPKLEVRRVEVAGEYAMVEVWAHASNMSWLPVPYRQTRFYQETEQGWLPTEPPAVFYQPVETLQAGRFTFVYGRRDAAAVVGAAQQVEDVDANLRAELGLTDSNGALTIRVVHNLLPWRDPAELMRMSDGATLYAPSPALLVLPTRFSEGDALLQLVAGLLIKRNLDEALASAPLTCERQPLVNGLHLWLLSEHSELPSLSRYLATGFLRSSVEHAMLPRLSWLEPDHNISPSDPRARGGCYNSAQASTAAAFTEYAVFAFGRDRLPALLDGIRRYDTWDGLIPAVFGVSAAEFEAGWQRYLDARYGGQSSRSSSTVP